MPAKACNDGSTADGRDRAHLLSFDVEEYFQVEAAAESGLSPEEWDAQPRRLDEPVDRLLELLDARGATATFFILGWVARSERELVERIARAGHEIASHGMGHGMIARLSREQFRAELADSRRLLEDISARPVIGYRAPTFSVTASTAWALDVLAEEGFAYDSSVFPVRHDRYGVPGAPAEPHWALGPAGGRLLEIPPLTVRLAGRNWPVGGGGYLRLLPAAAVARALAAAGRRGQSGMIYLHPWELDPGQPVLPMRRLARWRHRVGLARTAEKLGRLLGQFTFTSVAERLDDLRARADREFAYG